MKLFSRFASLLLLLLAPVLAAAEDRVITRAIDVRSLSVAEADSGIEARIRGVIVYVESPSGLFVQDETATTFFRTTEIPAAKLPKVGDEVEVRAKTRMGLYLPGLDYAAITVLGRKPLPPGIPATYDDLYFGRYHYSRVAVEGIVRSLSPQEGKTTRVRLALGSRVLEALVDLPPPADRNLVDQRVRITGLAAGFINMRVSGAAVASRVAQIAGDGHLGAAPVSDARRVIIDYGGPNV
ncbi:MAG: hypothetical protein V4773_01490, partial [Verrucomicrobiota bacterium]